MPPHSTKGRLGPVFRGAAAGEDIIGMFNTDMIGYKPPGATVTLVLTPSLSRRALNAPYSTPY
jgi:hypothetical protein